MPRTRSARRHTGAPSPQRANSPRPDGEQYLRALIAEQELADAEAVERNSDDDVNFDEDGSELADILHTDSSESSISDQSEPRPDREPAGNTSVRIRENGVPPEDPPEEIAISTGGDAGRASTAGADGNTTSADPPAQGMHPTASNDSEDEGGAQKPKGRSMIHHLLNQNRIVFLSLDLETGGEGCGIIQISAEVVRPSLKREGKKVAKDSLAGPVERGEVQYRDEVNPGGTLFNEYVNPGSDAEWSAEATAVTGLSGDDPRITGARNLNEVWSSFCRFVEHNIDSNERGVIVAYNGASCDMKWLLRLTQAPDSTATMPDRLAFYMDPLKIIKKRKSCPLHNPQEQEQA